MIGFLTASPPATFLVQVLAWIPMVYFPKYLDLKSSISCWSSSRRGKTYLKRIEYQFTVWKLISLDLDFSFYQVFGARDYERNCRVLIVPRSRNIQELKSQSTSIQLSPLSSSPSFSSMKRLTNDQENAFVCSEYGEIVAHHSFWISILTRRMKSLWSSESISRRNKWTKKTMKGDSL